MKDLRKLIEENQRSNKRKKIFLGLRKAIDITSSVASTLLAIRDKPTMLDYFSVGMTFTNTALKVHDEISKLRVSDPREYYSSDYHYILPYTLENTVFFLCKNVEQIVSSDKTSLNRGFLGKYEIFWIDSDGSKEKPFCLRSEKDEIIREIGNFLWQSIGTRNVMFDKSGFLIPSDETLNFEVVETSAMKELEKRILKFKEEEEPRSYLLEGPPGTGKSSAAMYIIKKLKLKSLRTSLTSIYGDVWQDQGNASANLDVLLTALEPDLIIVDDIDRSHMNEQQMLKLFETARKYCKIIIATCNNKRAMIGAMLRVGRFDDHIIIDQLDPEVVMQLLGEEDHDLVQRLSKWPIAYIQNYKTVKRVMGREQARSEIDDMEARILEIKRKSLREGLFRMGPEPEEEQGKPKKKKKRKKKGRKIVRKSKKKN